MKKYLLSFLFLLPMLAGAQNYETTIDGITYMNYGVEEVAIVSSYNLSGDVVIPKTVKCKLDKYNWTWTVRQIWSNAFSGCTAHSIFIPNTITIIQSNAFPSNKLASIVLEEGNAVYDSRDNCNAIIETATNHLVSGCKNTVIPNSVTSIGERAFSGCSDLTSVIIPNSVTSIGDYAFYNCSGLTSITISNSVTSIGICAFSDCSSLSSVTIPNSLNCINAYTFSDCSSLTDITIPNSVTSIGRYAFDGTGWYDNQPEGVVYAGKVVYSYKGTMPEHTHLALEEGTLGIAAGAFSGCANLKLLSIPSSVLSIGDDAFSGCSPISVTVGMTTPVSISKGTFPNRSTATLYVPAGCKNAYQAADYWKEFKAIKETTPVPAGASVIDFADETVKAICVENWDTNGDWELSTDEASAVTDLKSLFVENKSITSFDELRFFTGLKTLDGTGFYNCSSLTSILIPNSVTSIGRAAFRNCSCLSSVTIPNSVMSIGENAFSNCSSLASITIPNSVTDIGTNAFASCTSLISIVIPNSVTNIGKTGNAYGNPFQNCINLETIIVEIENPVYDSRENCNAIISSTENKLIIGCKNTVIPNTVVGISDMAFSGCKFLTSITIPNNIIYIGMDAFYNCSGLTSITIPNSVTSIGYGAFSGCSGLTSVTIGNSVTSVGDYAFASCSGLTSVIVGNPTPLSITENTFTYCRNATLYVPYGTKAAYEAADCWKDFKEIIEMSVPSPNIAFADANVKAICVAHWDTNGDGELSEAEAETVTDLGNAFNNTTITSFNELSYFTGLTYIGDGAFEYCHSLTSITIPNSVMSIGFAAFHYCSALTSISIPNSVTSIDYGAFAGSSLISITIPNSVTSIGSNAFGCCTSLATVIISNSVTSISDEAFYDCYKLTSVTIPNSVTSIGYEAFYGCHSLTSITIPNSVTSIDNGAFEGCSGLTSITIPSSVTKINDYAFYGCSGLTSVTIPNGVTSIEYSAFAGCSSLTSITIPNSVTSIGNSAFDECSGLTSITIPNSVTSIGNETFEGCSSLTSVTIGNGVTSIGNKAFSGCNNLTSVVVELDSPIAITKNVFSNRTNATLYVPKNSKPAYQSAIYWKDFKAIKEFPDADVNQDGVVNVVDVVDIARYVVDDPSPSFDKFLADLNGSGEVSVTDAVVLVNEIAGETSWARRSEQSTAANDQLLLFANADNSLSLHLEGDGQYTAFQLDLHLPADVDMTKALLNAQRKQKHQLLYNKVGEGVYRIIGLSTSGRTFLGNAGELLNMQLDDFATEDIMMDNIHFITPAAADVLFEPVMLTTETTGIAAINKADGGAHRVVYNLNGQRIAAPQKGLNIVNGKKLIVK